MKSSGNSGIDATQILAVFCQPVSFAVHCAGTKVSKADHIIPQVRTVCHRKLSNTIKQIFGTGKRPAFLPAVCEKMEKPNGCEPLGWVYIFKKLLSCLKGRYRQAMTVL